MNKDYIVASIIASLMVIAILIFLLTLVGVFGYE